MASYGAATALVSGTLSLVRDNNAKWCSIQNQDVTPMLVTFTKAGATLGQVALSAATAQGAPGGYIDSLGYPVLLDADTAVLTSTTTTAQFGSAQSLTEPVNFVGNTRFR